jgi:hypothetical protein
MKEENDSKQLQPEVTLELANELRRLVNHLVKELQKDAVLPGLSSLAAMRPIQQILTDELSGRVLTAQPEEAHTGESEAPDCDDVRYVGYL